MVTHISLLHISTHIRSDLFLNELASLDEAFNFSSNSEWFSFHYRGMFLRMSAFWTVIEIASFGFRFLFKKYDYLPSGRLKKARLVMWIYFGEEKRLLNFEGWCSCWLNASFW